MEILVTMHVDSEGPGSLGTFLEAQGCRLQTVRLYAGEALPADPTVYAAIISMGGPMNVYEDDRYPFLAAEAGFLRTAIGRNVPVLGICLGAQMLARVCGAEVTKSPVKEVGWCSVSLTDAGERDLFFHGIPRELEVLQWHEDMFCIPNGGVLLAASVDCPHQAFRYGCAYGLQFHVEVTREMLAEWFAGLPDLAAILARYDEAHDVLDSRAETIYRNWIASFRR
ncbi:MAG: type 1 glutamine amidotransferase [Desulfomonile sp.]|nr:type 1 glutamine amidotransferase [Desulfomonile sp.]